MANLKDLRKRINSVTSTRKITSAMKMVAGSKLKRAEAAAQEGRPYAERMQRMLSGLIATMSNLDRAPKLLSGTGQDRNHLLIVITGDRGLCGGFNVSIAREARRRVETLRSEGKEVRIICVGKKGRDALKRTHGDLIIETLENVTRYGAQFGPARDLAHRVRGMYEDGAFDVCTLIYNRFKSAMSQVVTVRQIIPFPVSETPESGKQALSESGAVYELEPSEELLLAELLPANVSVQIFAALLESFASEQGARMTAMDNATRNAGEIINKLTLNYNRTRQAAITKELIEIISGAEAV